jgi:hypothetical protein
MYKIVDVDLFIYAKKIHTVKVGYNKIQGELEFISL